MPLAAAANRRSRETCAVLEGKPARFWRMGACSLIPWQSTDMQRLRRGMKAEVWEAVLYLSMFSANMVFKWHAV